MTSPPSKIRTPASEFTKLKMSNFGLGKYQQPQHFKIKEAVRNCQGHKRNAERLAQRMISVR